MASIGWYCIRNMKVKDTKYTSKIENYIENHERLCVLMLMLFSAVFLAVPFLKAYPLHTTTDELGTIVGAATWAGYDWGGVIGRSGYYGFGYYSLFAPLFALKLSPITIYRIILVVTRVIRGCVISGSVYYIGKHYLQFTSKFMLMQVAFICTLPLYSDLDGTIVNDIVLEVIVWIIILLICKMIEYVDNPKKCVFVEMEYILVCMYAALLHTRAIIIVIASFLTIVGIFFVRKRKKLLAATLSLPAAYAMQPLIEAYQKAVWGTSGSNLPNAAVQISTDLNLLDLDTWMIWFDIVIGSFTVQTLLTGGLFLTSIVVVLKYLYAVFIRKNQGESIYVNSLIAMSMMSIGAVFLAFFVSNWFAGMYEAWGTSAKGAAYAFKGLCYVRYWNVFAMPFLFVGCYLIQRLDIRNWAKAVVGWLSVLLVAFILLIVPLVQTNYSAGTFLYKFLSDAGEKVNAEFYYKCIMICIVVVLACGILYYFKRTFALLLVPVVVMMAIGYNKGNEHYYEATRKQISSMVSASYEQKCKLEDANLKIEKVYAVDNRDTDHNWYIFSALQFYFYEHRVEEGLPADMGAYDIIVTRKPDMAIAEKYPSLSCYVLDNNEVWYTELDLIGVEPE